MTSAYALAQNEPAPLAVTTAQAASMLGVSAGTMRNWRTQGTGPQYLTVSQNKVIYRVADLEAWLDALPKVGA